MPNTFSFDIRRFSGVCCIEQPKTFGYAVCAYARLNSVFSLGHAKTACSVSSVRHNLVLDIFGRRNVSQIIQSIIVWISVNVVDVIFRPFAMRVKPNKPVRSVTLPIDAYYAVAKIIYRPCDAAHHNAPISFDPPTQNASNRVVRKQFLKTFMSKHGHLLMVLSCGRQQRMSMVKAP